MEQMRELSTDEMDKVSGGTSGEIIAGACPKCFCLVNLSTSTCPGCGYIGYTKTNLINCPTCGKSIDANSGICLNCGNPVSNTNANTDIGKV